MRHVRVNGFRFDGRMRMATKRKTVSDGKTFCGAEGTAEDTDRKNAEASIKGARAFPQLSHWLKDLCPDCVRVLDRSNP